MTFQEFPRPLHRDTEPVSVVRTVDLDGDEEALLVGIYEAVADAVSADPQIDEIPIHERIDPTALHEVFVDDDGESVVTFPVWDVWVHVRSDGSVLVFPDK